MGQKRPRDETMDSTSSSSEVTSAFQPMFETFRKELDEHHDRRERVIKASRDITAGSKKIIFALQRARKLDRTLPPAIIKGSAQYYTTIETQYTSIASDIQGLNAHRYSGNISGGNQEYIEAASFQHYLTTGTLLSYDESCAQLRGYGGIGLDMQDYLLGIFDMTGELMRFAITAMATGGRIPSSSLEDSERMEVDAGAGERDVLTDLRALRAALEKLETGPGSGWFARDVEKKMSVMRTSVEKVEKALYGLVIRGRERPSGWMPELESSGRREIDVEA